MLPDAKVQKIKYKKIKAHLNPLFSINKELGRNQKKTALAPPCTCKQQERGYPNTSKFTYMM